nr:translocation protein SEC62-like [Tanacetum cinerariifolium]
MPESNRKVCPHGQEFSDTDAFFAWTFVNKMPLWQTLLSLSWPVLTLAICLFPVVFEGKAKEAEDKQKTNTDKRKIEEKKKDEDEAKRLADEDPAAKAKEEAADKSREEEDDSKDEEDDEDNVDVNQVFYKIQNMPFLNTSPKSKKKAAEK